MKFKFLALLIVINTTSFCQTGRSSSTFLSFQGNVTTYDRTITNNSGGIGLGLQTHIGKRTQVKAMLEASGDLFAGTKELYTTGGGKPIEAKSGVLSLYGGPLLQVTKAFFITAEAGTSFYNRRANLGVRSSVALFPSNSKRWLIRSAYTNVFQRDEISNESFGYLSFSVAVKLR